RCSLFLIGHSIAQRACSQCTGAQFHSVHPPLSMQKGLAAPSSDLLYRLVGKAESWQPTRAWPLRIRFQVSPGRFNSMSSVWVTWSALSRKSNPLLNTCMPSDSTTSHRLCIRYFLKTRFNEPCIWYLSEPGIPVWASRSEM